MRHPSLATKGVIIFSIGFIAVLLASGYMEREWFVPHLFQSLIYVAIIFLVLKESKWSYGIGISMATFWNGYNLFKSGFLGAGIRQLKILIDTGTVPKPEHFIAVPAWIDHLLLIVCCVMGYWRLKNKKLSDVFIPVASGVISVGYLWLIIYFFFGK